MADLNKISARQRAVAVEAWRTKPLPPEADRLINDDVPALLNELHVLREIVAAPCQEHCCTQQTKCAGCGKQKHTPLRRDEMGGYVCLTCVDNVLDRLGALAAQWKEHAKSGCSTNPADVGAFAATANCARQLAEVLGGPK